MILQCGGDFRGCKSAEAVLNGTPPINKCVVEVKKYGVGWSVVHNVTIVSCRGKEITSVSDILRVHGTTR